MIIPVAAQIHAKWLQFHASLATAAAYKNTPGLFFLNLIETDGFPPGFRSET